MEKKRKKKKPMFIIGVIMIVIGFGVLAFYGYRKISREIYLRLQVSAGHFEGTGALGKGNYCIAGHNSTIYAEIFNDLDQIQIGDEMYLVDIDKNRTRYKYVVTEYKTVEPSDTWVLNDFGDDRLTVISCTDDGKQRQVVVGILKNDIQIETTSE